MPTAKRRKKEKIEGNVKEGKFLKTLLYVLLSLSVLFIIYRGIVLLAFKVDCSTISSQTLSQDASMISDLYIFESNGKITSIEVLIFSKDQKNILKISVPSDLYVTEEGVDSFPLSSLESVGEFLEYGSGKSYAVGYLSSLLGIKFDNYVWLVDSQDNVEDFLNKLSIWSILFDFKYSKQLHGNISSNLPILNLIGHVNFLNTVMGEYEYEIMDISECCIKEIVISSDNKQWHFDRGSFDSAFIEYIDKLRSKEVEKERVNVEVYNASNTTGLASVYARKIRHTGCRILRYDNSPNLYDSTVIYVPELTGYEASLRLVRDVMGQDVELRYERPIFITTGDIVVVLGKDISK